MVYAMSEDDARISRDRATRFVSSAFLCDEKQKKNWQKHRETQVSCHADPIGFAVSRAPIVDRGAWF